MWQIIISLKKDRTQEGVLAVWTYLKSIMNLIFLFNYVIKDNSIDFVLNEGLAEDMYSDLETTLKYLVENNAKY